MKSIKKIPRRLPEYPTRAIQFGEGNFLRAFIEWQLQQMNKKNLFKGRITLIQPIDTGLVSMLHEQDNRYTILIEGILNKSKVQSHEIIESVSDSINPYSDYEKYQHLMEDDNIEFIFSNTTEAGITYNANDKLTDTPQISFPGKLTALLYQRYLLGKKGFQIIPCELIENNGQALELVVNQYIDGWHLGGEFKNWVTNENTFYSSLVDRIVPGYPKNRATKLEEEFGYHDKLIVKTEPFLIWIIQGSKELITTLPLKKAGLNVIVTDDLTPYRQRKVFLLNGPHSTMTPIALLAGLKTVNEVMQDADFGLFIKNEMFNEIIPTINLTNNELTQYANSIIERFENPYVDHQLSSISLNSISKFNARLLPILKTYFNKNRVLPPHIIFALAAYLKIYQGNTSIKPIDTKENLTYFSSISQDTNYLKVALSNNKIWGEDLTKISGLLDLVTKYYQLLNTEESVRELVKNTNSEVPI